MAMNAETAKRLAGATDDINLVGHKRNNQFEIWVWADATGQGYVTKQPNVGDAFGWKLIQPNWEAATFLANNKTIISTQQKDGDNG